MTMPVVAIDRTKGSRNVFTCSNEVAAEIQAWREAQRPLAMSEREPGDRGAAVAGADSLARGTEGGA
jgi:hypothetical protein